MTVVRFKGGVNLAYFFVHLTGFGRVLALLQITPVEKEFLVKFDEERFVVSEDAQYFGVLISLVLQVMENLLPKLEIVSLGHERSLVTVTDVLNNSIFSLKLKKFPPVLFFFPLFLRTLKIVSLYFLLYSQSLLSVL